MNLSLSLGIPFTNVKNKRIAFDSFNRPNNNNIGRLESGQNWSTFNGAWSILNNMAENSVHGSSGYTGAIVDGKISDFEMELTISSPNISSCRPLFRGIDNANFLMIIPEYTVGSFFFYKIVATSPTVLASVPVATKVGDVYKIIGVRENIKIYINNQLKLDINVADYVNGTIYGMCRHSSLATPALFDNFILNGV